MPPRLPGVLACCRAASANSSFNVAHRLPSTQVRNAAILASLSDNPGAHQKRIRKGRGPSSGKGKTSGRGHKGQKQHGKVPARFQGGQTPPHIVHGKRGFENLFSLEMSTLNLERVQAWIDQGRLDPTKPITVKELVESRCLHGVKDGVKLLARGKEDFKSQVNILVSRASATAIEAIEAAGGKITTRYYTKTSIKRVLRGESESTFTPLGSTPLSPEESPIIAQAFASSPFRYRLPDATSRKDLEYYRDSAHRGYLSHLVEDGEGPSLFFQRSKAILKKPEKKASQKAAEENKLW